MVDHGMETSAGLGRLELIRIAESVAHEKGIGVDDVIVAMEQAIQTAARRKYGQEHQIVAEVDRKTGDIGLYRELEVSEEVEDPAIQIALERGPRAQSGRAGRRPHPRAAAADRPRADRRPERQAGDRPEGPRGRARAPVRASTRTASARSWSARSSGPSTATCWSTSAGPRRSSAATRCSRARPSATRTACAPTSTMSGPRRAGRRSSCRAPIRSSWPSCSRRRCRRSTTASSRSRRSPAIPARAPRSPWSPRTAASTRSAPASACAARACRRWSTSCRARRSTSFRGRPTPRPSWSMPWRRPRSARSCSTRTAGGSR